MLRKRFSPLIFILSILFCSCSAKYQNKIDFDPSEPLRIAVLPFAYLDSKGEIVDFKPGLLIDNISLVSTKLEEAPVNFVRDLVYTSLEKSGLDPIPPLVIESAFHHNGFSNKNILDIKRILNIPPADLGKFLNCDALMYGYITEWDRSYYGIQSVNSVGIKLKLVSAKSGNVLFSTEAEDSDSRGLTKGPTGWSSLILEPVKGLDNQIIADLAKKVVNNMMEPLYVKRRSPMLESITPSIFASSHDARTGKISLKDHLTVLVYGTSKKTATFSLGDKVLNIPMWEKETGHYIGEYYPIESDEIQDEPVIVRLADDYGRKAEQKIGMGNVTLSK